MHQLTHFQPGMYLEGQLISEGVSPSASFCRNHSWVAFPVLPCTRNKTLGHCYKNVDAHAHIIYYKQNPKVAFS